MEGAHCVLSPIGRQKIKILNNRNKIERHDRKSKSKTQMKAFLVCFKVIKAAFINIFAMDEITICSVKDQRRLIVMTLYRHYHSFTVLVQFQQLQQTAVFTKKVLINSDLFCR